MSLLVSNGLQQSFGLFATHLVILRSTAFGGLAALRRLILCRSALLLIVLRLLTRLLLIVLRLLARLLLIVLRLLARLLLIVL